MKGCSLITILFAECDWRRSCSSCPTAVNLGGWITLVCPHGCHYERVQEIGDEND